VPFSIISSAVSHFVSYPLQKIKNRIDLEHSKLLAYKKVSIREAIKLCRKEEAGLMAGVWSPLSIAKVGQGAMVLAIYQLISNH
jgi:hypothetical protein